MIKFGTGGWRAIIGEDFICDNIRRVAAAVVRLAQEQHKMDKPIIVGYDRRFLSESAARWVAETLAAGGITVWLLHRSAPTPFIMHTVMDQQLHFGIEITASHNPSNYNGIKLIVDEGRDAPVETTERLEELIAELDEVKYCDLDTAVGIKGGHVKVVSSTITGKGPAYDPKPEDIGKSGFIDTGDGVYIETNYGYEITLEISEDNSLPESDRKTVLNSDHSRSLRVFEETAPNVAVKIYAGTFKETPSPAYIAPTSILEGVVVRLKETAGG